MSSYLTLKAMLIIAIVGLVPVFACILWSYRVFRGKARSGEHY